MAPLDPKPTLAIPAQTVPALTLCDLKAPADGRETHSPFCLKVRRALNAAGLVFTVRREAMPGAYADLNPMKQVPILLAGDAVIVDSPRIVAQVGVWAGWHAGRDPAQAAEARHWERLADTVVNGHMVAARWADDAHWPRVREALFGGLPAPLRLVVPGRVRKGVVARLRARGIVRPGLDDREARFLSLLADLEQRAPGTGWWAGDTLSEADFALFGQLQSLRCDLTPAARAAVEAQPRLAAWLDRVDQATLSARRAAAA